jgi:hypothetical protein
MWQYVKPDRWCFRSASVCRSAKARCLRSFVIRSVSSFLCALAESSSLNSWLHSVQVHGYVLLPVRTIAINNHLQTVSGGPGNHVHARPQRPGALHDRKTTWWQSKLPDRNVRIAIRWVSLPAQMRPSSNSHPCKLRCACFGEDFFNVKFVA